MESLQSFNIQELIEKAKARRETNVSGKKDQPKKTIEFNFGVKKESLRIALGVLGAFALLATIGTGLSIKKHLELNTQLTKLNRLETYDLSIFESHDLIKDHLGSLTNLEEMINFYDESKLEKEKVETELNFKKSVYSDFLRNLLLPSLNIWKNPYTQEIDLSILGKKYLDKNPYQDITLLDQRSSIIRDSGKDVGTNEVTNMQIWDIVEEENGSFHIPISISFKSDSKRAFLLLVDKLSQTSSISNIGLFNDFTYHLFDTIREEKKEVLQELATSYKMNKHTAEDERTFNNLVISHYLYDIITTGAQQENLLIDNTVVDKAIKSSVLCNNKESRESCYFRFRDKYRNLPSLAYSIGIQANTNKASLLKNFYAEVPPLIAIKSFTFDKAKAQGVSFAQEGEYVGNVNFSIYGRGISAQETEEISTLLKNACLGKDSSNDIDMKGAIAIINDKIKRLGANTDNSESKVTMLAELIELKETFSAEENTFEKLSPYNKMIKKFEIYRSLKNLSLCI